MIGDDWVAAVRSAALVDAARLRPADIEHACHVIADTVGVCAAGHRFAPVRRLLSGPDPLGPLPFGASGSATVLSVGTGRAAPELAAFLNATAGSFLELDEGMRPTGHPGMQVVPAALAVAETVHASGTQLVNAVIAGYEVTSRLFRAFRLTYPVHPHGHFGAVGAAVAVALLSGADPVEAASIAATTPLLSTWGPCFEGATARNTWMGLAAQSGVNASRLARAGFTGSQEGLAAAFGEIAGSLHNHEVLGAALDYGQLGIRGNYFKLHSACALTHAALDAVLAMTLPPTDEIRRIRVETVQNNMKVARQARPNDLSTRFSLPYAVAAAVVHRRTDPSAFDFDERVAELARRVEISVAPDLEARWPAASPARVIVETADSETHNEVDNPVGYHTAPLSSADLYGKFSKNVGAGADVLWQRLTALYGEPDCANVFAGWG
jgi:2-methylcitrate dehydratase PrpD